jgi:simple sugar transport system permease protein
MRSNRIFWAVVAPLAAVLTSILLVSGILLMKGANPISTFHLLITYGFDPRNVVSELNQTVAYYLAGVAAAIGFKMMLFNIGIDGQYRLAVFFAAVVGGAVALPPILHVGLIVIVAVLVGGAWAAISGYLKVKRGVSEVISNIMLNFIAGGIISYLLSPLRLGSQAVGSQNMSTTTIPKSGSLPTLKLFDGELYSFGVMAIVVGIFYWVLLNRSVFGFNLRATGMSFRAARASGVNAPRMVFITMMLSGAIAGLTGIGTLLSDTHAYSLAFPSGYALTGLALALLGRNHPVGIAFAAFFWAFLERSAGILDLNGIPNEIITMMQGTIVLSIVVAYEVVKRINKRQQQNLVGSHDATSEVSK